MEDHQAPPAPDDRLAIVIIHGIGNQQPLDTLLPFAENLIEEPAHEGEPKFWSKPDRLSESFELRRLTARKSQTRPTTDFYEYYWAHHIPGATYKQLINWARRLLLVNPNKLLPKIRIYWRISWFIFGLALVIFGSSFFYLDQSTYLPFTNIEINKGILGLIIALALPMITALLEHILLKYVGDAARYLQPDPENIQLRHEIRAKGIKLIRDLHAVKNGKQKYSRIVVVGHSLGSVIAYDVLKNLWDEYNTNMASGPDSVLATLEALALDLQTAEGEQLEKKAEVYQQYQRLYWKERYEAAHAAGLPAWLVTDLVTLGSPLVHANVLLNTKFSSVTHRKTFRELPTCPPVMENKASYGDKKMRFSYQKWNEHRRPTNHYIPHHAAVFSATAWTNMYFPGDVVGDKLAPIFGPGIKDITLALPPARLKGHSSPASHTLYWTKVSESTDHLVALRNLLGFSNTLKISKQDTVVKFSKSNTMLGLQCNKALWLDQYKPDLREPFSASDLHRFKQGNAVDKAAQTYYPGGVEVGASDWALALHNTEMFINQGQKRLYQAAFEHNDLRIRADVLDFNDDGSCSLREVKMSTRKKDEHVLDIGIQMYVMHARNLTVRDAHVVFVNREYIAGGDISLFSEEDVTADAQAFAEQMEANLASYKEVLQQDDVPDIAIGPHCTKPWTCPFHAHCWQHVPADSIYTIPRLHATKKEMLIEQGILRVKDVPEGFPLSATQAAYVALQKSGEDATDKSAIQKVLNKLARPLYFLDFETYSTPLPMWPGTKPNQQIPFQFSCHKLDTDNILTHGHFLHTTTADPRRMVADALLGWIGEEGTILVYNESFEKKVLEDLADYLPEHATRFNGMIARLFDQLKMVKEHVDHPGLLGSNSLKKVSDVLLKDQIKYGELDIAEGESAQAGWYKMVQLPADQRGKLAKDLEAYCRMDTKAQVELHRWFMG